MGNAISSLSDILVDQLPEQNYELNIDAVYYPVCRNSDLSQVCIIIAYSYRYFNSSNSDYTYYLNSSKISVDINLMTFVNNSLFNLSSSDSISSLKVVGYSSCTDSPTT